MTESFKEMATGKWILKEWGEHTYSMGYRSRQGFRIAVSVWSTIFHNRFYLGETWLRKGDVPTRGNHDPLTDEDTFARVQEVLKAHDNYKQRIQRHKYLLQRILFSEDSGTPCFVETHPKKKISYYRTKGKVNGSQVFYNSRDIDEQLLTVMRRMTVSEDIKAELQGRLEKWFAAENNDNGELERAKQRLVKLERMEKNLQDLVLEEEISKEDFKEHRMRIQSERANLKDLIDITGSRRSLIRADFEIALEIASKLDLLYESGDNNNRRLLCETLFRQVRVRNGKIVKIQANPPFALIASQAGGSESLLSGQPVHLR